MYLITFEESGRERVGLLDTDNDEVVDIAAANPDMPETMLDLIHQGDGALQRIQALSTTDLPRFP